MKNTEWQWCYDDDEIDPRPMLTRTWHGYQQTITALYPHLFECEGVCVPYFIEFYDRDFNAMMDYMDACIAPKRRSPLALEEYREAKAEAYQEKWDLAVQPVHDGFGGVWSRP
jgi:hypothetical protein